MNEALLVNVGCGSVFHRTWVNFDSNPTDNAVRRLDIRSGLPLANGQAHACYSAHLLEHLSRADAGKFVVECHRVLRPTAVLRLVVPDLEAIAREYLRVLDDAVGRKPSAESDYEWILLELFDQMVRTRPGGDMHAYLTSGKVTNPSFVISRTGIEAEQLIRGSSAVTEPRAQSARQQLAHVFRRLREELAGVAATALLGREGGQALKEGLFHRSGQLHLWMYDRYSLSRLLEDCGFAEVTVCAATESRIPNFALYELDVVAGRVRKPDSLFVEAVRP